MTKTSFALRALLVLALAGQAAIAATPPGLISYQGVLRSASGVPLDGTYDMVFRFTDAPDGGTLLLTDFHAGPNGVVVTGGLFTALLGGGLLSPGTEASLQDIFARYSPVYVEVQVGAETLAPRVQVVSTGFALNAGQLGGQLPDGYLDVSVTDQVKDGSLTSNTGFIAQPGATTGDVRAVQGTTVSSSGVGVLGSALASNGMTEGVRGQSTSPDGRGVVGGAFATSGAAVGVFGESQSPEGTGVYGRATAATGGTVGVGGEIFSTLGTGVAGVARATSGDAWGVYGETASPTGYGVVSIGDSVTDGDVYATGTKYFLAEHPFEADLAIQYACLEGDEIGVYHRGSGRLANGEARIALPDPFPFVASGRITVQVTPLEECAGLYVPQEGVSPEGFTVRELDEGTTNAAFTFLVLAERIGYEGAAAERPITLSEKILASRLLGPDQKASLRAALASTSTEPLSETSRSELFSTLHQGDFDGTCDLLGGCPASPDTLFSLGHHAPAADAEPTLEAAATTAASSPDRSTGPFANQLISIDSARDEAAAPPRRRIPPPSLADLLVVGEAVEAGDVVVLDRPNGTLRLSATPHDRNVVGVVAFVEGRVPSGDEAPVVVAGTVPCNVDAEYGPIAAGDLLVVSPTLGHAMRAERPAPGSVLGKAMEPLESGRGTIKILVVLR